MCRHHIRHYIMKSCVGASNEKYTRIIQEKERTRGRCG